MTTTANPTEKSSRQEITGWASDIALSKYFEVHRNTIWRWSKSGLIPKPQKLTTGCVRWRWAEILEAEKKFA